MWRLARASDQISRIVTSKGKRGLASLFENAKVDSCQSEGHLLSYPTFRYVRQYVAKRGISRSVVNSKAADSDLATSDEHASNRGFRINDPEFGDMKLTPAEMTAAVRLTLSPNTNAVRNAPMGEPLKDKDEEWREQSTLGVKSETESQSDYDHDAAVREADEARERWLQKRAHLFQRGKVTLDSFEPLEIEMPDSNHKHGRPNITQDIYNLLASQSPPFFCHAEDIESLSSPTHFYEELLKMTSRAEKRICFSALYLGAGPMEKRLLDTINKRMYEKPSLCAHFMFDYARSHRKDKNGKTAIQPIRELIAQHPTHSSAALIHAPRVRRTRLTMHSGFSAIRPSSIRKRLFERCLMYAQSPKLVELGGVHHMKFYVVDDTVIISGANLSEIYFTNREDRYVKVRHPALCDIIIQTAQILSLGCNSSILSLDHEMRSTSEDIRPELKEQPYYDEAQPTYTGPQPVGPEEAAVLGDQHTGDLSVVNVTYTPETFATPAFAREQAAARKKLEDARRRAAELEKLSAKAPLPPPTPTLPELVKKAETQAYPKVEASDVVAKFMEPSRIANLPHEERQLIPSGVVRSAMIARSREPEPVTVPVAVVPHRKPNSSTEEIHPAYPLTSIPKDELDKFKDKSKALRTSHTVESDVNFGKLPSAPVTWCPPDLIKNPPRDPRPFVKARVRLPLVEPLYDRWQIGIPRFWLFNPDFACSGTVEYRQPGLHKMFASDANMLYYDEFDQITPIDNATFFANAPERKRPDAVDYSSSRPYWEEATDKKVVRPGIQARFSDDEPSLRYFMRTEGRLNFRTEDFQLSVLGSILSGNYRLIQSQYDNWFKDPNAMFPNPVDPAALPHRDGADPNKQPDTVIFPFIQISQRGVIHDELATSAVLKTLRMRCLPANVGYAAVNMDAGINLPLHEARQIRKDYPLIDPVLIEPNASLFKFEENRRKLNINFCTGYFNMSERYSDLLEPIMKTNDRNSLNIVVASKQANGWFDANGIQKYVPDFYIAIAEQFLTRFKSFGDRVSIREYWRKGWSYHAKGLWIQEFDEPEDDKANNGKTVGATKLDTSVPLIHFMGSSNFGDRSLDRDLEMQFCLITRNKELIQKMDADLQRSMEHSQPRPAPSTGLMSSFKPPVGADDRFPEADEKANELVGWRRALIKFICKSALFRSLL